MKFKIGDRTNLKYDKFHKNEIINIEDDCYIVKVWNVKKNAVILSNFRHSFQSYNDNFEMDLEWQFNKEMHEVINEG